jgi:pimeloyl-ACP methyl ester carboxylesterase
MAIKEQAVQFGTGAGLVGVLCHPRGPQRSGSDRPSFLILNAGILHHVGPSRVHVTLARALASKGFTTLRFDFSGIGDSEPRRDGLHVDEATVAEIREAMEFLLQKRGATRFVIGGICSGADGSFRGALADPRIVGVVLVDGYAYRNFRYHVHRNLPRLLRLRSWRNFVARRGRSFLDRIGVRLAENDAAPRWRTAVRVFPPKDEVERGLQALADRGVEQLHLYTAGQQNYQNYATQFWDNFNGVDFKGKAELHYLAQADHTFTDLDQQAQLVALVTAWMERVWATVTVEASSNV